MEAQVRKSLYERLSGHFQACLDLPEQERQQYISNLAVSSPDLEKELRSLLRFHDGNADPAAPSPASPPSTTREGTRTRKSKSWLSTPILILIVGAASLAITLSVQAWALARLEGDLKRQMASSLKAAVDLRVSNLRSWAAAQKQQARKVMEDPILVEHVAILLEVAKKSEDRETRNALLSAHPSAAIVADRVQRASPEIIERGYGILSASGISVATECTPLLGIALSSAAADVLGRVNLGETFICRPYPDRLYAKIMAPQPKNPVMFVAGPIRDASGQIIALGSFKMSPTHFNEILGAAVAEFVAFDVNGLVLNPLKGGTELQSWGVTPGPETALYAYLRDPGVNLTTGARPEGPPDSWPETLMCRTAVQGRDGMDAIGHRDLRGQMVVAAWAWLPEWGMGIGGQMPVDRVLAPTAPVRTAFTTLAGVFTVLTAGLFVGSQFLRIRRRKGQDSAFGAYKVERPIGKGGMAEVFLAHHAFLKRPAALKILSQPHPDAAAIERFEREARLASRLSHPNTIQVFDFGETADGRLYYAMEYVEGLNLAQFLTLSGPPPIGRAVHLLQQIAGSLGEAHLTGLLHRDLKPSNIMLSTRVGLADLVKVLDFGIACSLTPGTDDFTRSTALVGTPAFLAPERIRSPQSLDRRSDLYAFGAVAFFLLTGRHVFEGASATELLYQVMTAARPSPSRLRGSPIPAALEKLVLDCLSIEPDRRPSQVQDVEAVLDAVAAVEPWTQAEALAWWAENQERVAAFIRATH